MTAVNVYWEKSGGGATSSKNDDGVVDTWKDDPKPGSEHGTGKSCAAGQRDGDEGPPRLKRAGDATAARAAPISRDPDDPGPPRAEARRRVADPQPTTGPPKLKRGGVPTRRANGRGTVPDSRRQSHSHDSGSAARNGSRMVRGLR